MAVPPDSNNLPTTSAASEQHGSDLTLNGAASSAESDAIPDLRLEPDVNSSSTLTPGDMPLEQRDSVPPTQAQAPRVDIFIPDEVDRSWFSRLLSLKGSWEKRQRRSVQYEPVTMAASNPSPAAPTDADRTVPSRSPSVRASSERAALPRMAGDELVTAETISNLEKRLASLAALRDVCTSIDQRLQRVEAASGRVEAAIQRTEGVAAQSLAAGAMLPEISANIEKQLVQAGMARTEQAVADTTLHELCQNIDARLARTEDALHRSEGGVAERLQELSTQTTARFAGVEESLRLTPQSLADSMLPTIDLRLARTEDTLRRNEGVVAERLQELSTQTSARLAGVEERLRLTPQSFADSMLPTIEKQIVQNREALQRSEEAVADRMLHELCRNIDARLERTEDRLHRNEGVIAEWLEEVSARMTARLVEAEETIQRIERIVSNRPVEQHPSRPLERPPGDVAAVVDLRTRLHANSENRKPVSRGIRARAALLLSRFPNIKQTNGRLQLPWVTGLAAPVLVLVAALAIGSLFRTNRSVAPENVALPAATEQTSSPALPATNQAIGVPSSPALMANAPRSTGESLVTVPQERAPNREAAPTASRGPRYVGTLSITSVPSGASVSINGRPAGKTPLRLTRQRAGSLAVQIAHDGFERWSAAVLVPADQLTQVTARLRATAR